ncbi:MAG: dipeptidase [Candidatus Latescibacteria bacterium]|nr:dipeptidase [Candidatus Latescibacterota bacterium]
MNEKIQRARDVALGILKPDARDLEHGLELHANALVCDAYGFAPRAAWDGDAMRVAIEAGTSEADLKDLEEEMSMTRCVTDAGERAEFQEAWEASGVTCIFQNAGEESQAPLRIIKRLASFTYVGDMLREFLVRATVPDDIVAARRQNRRCFYTSRNGVPLAQDWVSVEEEMGFIRVFFQLGVRMMHLTYNRRNMIGDGCAEPANAGLSDFGRAVVKEMNRAGVIVDVAHAGWQTSLEAAQASERPMVASHSGCCAVNRHIRCKPDEVIRAIADTGGYVGICSIPAFLGRSGDIQAMLDHVDYVARTFGVDHVAIGTDTAYVSRNEAAERKKVPARRRVRSRWEGFWPPDAFGAQWRQESMTLSLAWTNWPLFTVGLVQRGYTDEDIQKILGGNALRVARAVWTE